MKTNLLKIALCLTLLVAIVSSFTVAFAGAEEPIMTIACFADLHVEYNLQGQEFPMRPSIQNAIDVLKNVTDDGADIVLVGGDMTGGRGSWSEAKITKTKAAIAKTMAEGSKTGTVLYVTGNHDSEPSAAVKKTGDYSGDYTKFMPEMLDELYVSDLENNQSPHGELLCYHYNLNGLDFIGINTPYVVKQGTSCGWYKEQTDWVKAKVEEIGEDKTIIIFSHYPLTAIRTITSPNSAMDQGGNTCRTTMASLLNRNPKIIYCYGHYHSGDKYWAKKATGEVVTTPGRALCQDREQMLFTVSQYIYCHMGSMGYYDNEYQPGGLGAVNPKVVQFVLISIYSDRITFQSYNTGEKIPPNGTQAVKPFSVIRDMATELGGKPADSNTDTSSDASTDVTDTNTEPASNNSSVTGWIVGGVVGAVVLIGAAVCVVLLVSRKKSK